MCKFTVCIEVRQGVAVLLWPRWAYLDDQTLMRALIVSAHARASQMRMQVLCAEFPEAEVALEGDL